MRRTSARAGVRRGGVSGRRCATCNRFERGTFLLRECERLNQQCDCVLTGAAEHATLEVANGAHTHAGPSGQFLLRQTRRDTILSKQDPEWRRSNGGHKTTLLRKANGYSACHAFKSAHSPVMAHHSTWYG